MAATAHGTLTADQVTTVSIDPGPAGIEIINRDQAGVIWVRVDDVNPVPLGAGTFAVLGSRTFPARRRGQPISVRLVAQADRAYSVEAI